MDKCPIKTVLAFGEKERWSTLAAAAKHFETCNSAWLHFVFVCSKC